MKQARLTFDAARVFAVPRGDALSITIWERRIDTFGLICIERTRASEEGEKNEKRGKVLSTRLTSRAVRPTRIISITCLYISNRQREEDEAGRKRGLPSGAHLERSHESCER